jgi:hypothetical protein
VRPGDSVPDYDAQDSFLERHAGRSGNDWHDATWHLGVDINPEEALASRDRMKLELARYGRLGEPGEGLGWDDVSAVQLRRFHKALGEILKDEGSGAGLEH